MIELKNNKLYIQGKPVRNFRYMTNPYLLIKFLLEKQAVTRQELREFCYENDIPLSHFDVLISALNKEVKKKFKKPLIKLKGNKFSRVYYLNPAFTEDNRVLVQLYIPAEILKKYESELKNYIIKDSDEKSI